MQQNTPRKTSSKMEFGQALAAFCKDFQNPKAAWIKVIFFFLTGATACLYPFLPLYMKSLGLRLSEVAVILSLTPVFAVTGTYLAGKVALKTSNVKALLTALTALCGLLPLLLLTVPAGRTVSPLPHFNITLTIFCGITSHPEMFLLPVPPVSGPSCHLPEGVGVVREIRVGACGHMCARPLNPPPVRSAQDEEEQLYVRARAIELDSRFFMPDSNVPTWDCSRQSSTDHGRTCNQSVEKLLAQVQRYANVSIHVETHPHLTARTIATVLGRSESPMGDLWQRCRHPGAFHQTAMESHIHHNYHCEHQCVASAESHDLCVNRSMVSEADVALAFWLLLVIKSANTLLASLTLALLEAAVGAFLREAGSGTELGRQKTVGLLGKVLLPIAVGFLVDVFSDVGRIQFTCLFLTYTVLELVAAGFIWFSSLTVMSEPQIPVKNVLTMLKNIELDVLLFTAFACGVFSGYLDHYALWQLEELGGRMWLLALTVAVAALAALPLVVLAEPLVQRLGAGNLVAAGLAVVGIKLFGYGLLVTPELCLLIELCEPLVGPLFISAVLRYSRNITSKANSDTTGVLVATAHYGFGRGICAALIGGLMFCLELDFPQSAQILGGTALASGVIYYLFWHCCFKYVRQVMPGSSESAGSQRSRWGSVRYLSFRRSRMRRAAAQTGPADTRADLSTIEEDKKPSPV
ncbi:uncharacterized protein LOC119097627 [Pollicipes pollicipes]|uniref:uncharacterized protein LOC119097627 n=1 Tax=Pollicipes pollicipes TaxID=41117 RepID=UPI001884A2BF|nr:uncharacterized protein LOC119097627 [Pollicipes pollicipes]XP_037076559.1 uncharacterized protein LOC119097627 [Pollicipes pollicipes]XP_037076561.1 uncharacterized protein LOC119097627 [Pollicipes pollicipes]